MRMCSGLGERVGLDADEPEQAGGEALDLVAQDLDVVGRGGRLERADEVERHAGVGAGRVDGEAGAPGAGAAMRSGVMPERARPSRQVCAGLRPRARRG